MAPSIDRRIEIRKQINQIGLKINALYDGVGSSHPVPTQASINEKIASFQGQINRLREEDRKLDTDAHQLEQGVHNALRDLVRHCAVAAPILDQFTQVWILRNDPVDHLLKLKSLLAQALRAVTDDPMHDLVGSPQIKAVVRNGLEMHRTRVATYDQLASEEPTIHRETTKYTTVSDLKRKFPNSRLWKVLSPKEQSSLLSERFTPKAYATTLTLGIKGLTSRESIRYSKRVLRAHSKKAKT